MVSGQLIKHGVLLLLTLDWHVLGLPLLPMNMLAVDFVFSIEDLLLGMVVQTAPMWQMGKAFPAQ